MAEAQIILAHARESGIVAIAQGEQHKRARTALAETGFRRDDDGVYHLPVDGTETIVADLVACAKRHRVAVHPSGRRFIGDAARDLASQLPGRWRTSVQIYSHPSWQEDLVPWIWDSGELGRAIQSERIPYAATLRDAEHGTTLLFVERPGHDPGYVVGAFAPEGLEEGYADPHAPRSIVVPPFSGRAARAVADRFLPAYEQAVHARRTAVIAAALESIRADYGAWQTVVASGRFSDATPLSAAALGAASEEFLDNSWRSFFTTLDHAPALIDRCRPASSPWPADAETLSRLADAVIAAEDLGVEVALGGFVAPQERRARAWPAIETWLVGGETFLRQARVSAPHRRPALPVSAPIRSLAAGHCPGRSR
ncbi:hypothetical protein ACFWRV_01920 [Streptomyces sp. NPDC058576]|uniref:hypothetical protein n=1 Tax=Streptomyces sp. NPDC058576 TaxID=3346547 RepID=UPI00365B6AA1